MKLSRFKRISQLDIRIYVTYVQLLIMNRWFSARHGGVLRLLGKHIEYPKRGSLHGMYKEIFIKKNYAIDPTNNPIVIVDCGSNIGLSILYFSLLAPNAKIISFEPNPHTFSILKKNIANNNFNVELHNAGVSNEAGEVTFYTDREDMSSQSASMTKHLETKNRPLVPLSVVMEKLSDIIQGPIDVLKLDIEGAEGEVLEDLMTADKLKYIKKVFIEYHYDGANTVYPLGRLLSFLDGTGFRYAIETGVSFPYTIPVVPKNYSYKIVAWKK